MDDVTKDSLSPSDHDTLIRVETKFDVFIKQYAIDMKVLQDGTSRTLSDHSIRIEKIEKTIDEFKPVETLKQINAHELLLHDLKFSWKLVLLTGGIIGAITSFILAIITIKSHLI